ncbi:MAG: hypothetical protein K1X64_22035 [Myxococcaceae bacterium]|nr:hypothetical protein [Myxococcaceae bacterium]
MSEHTSKAKRAVAEAPTVEGEHRTGTEASWSEVLGVKERVEKNPYGMVAAAFGVGYVLGGGLFTPTTARVVGLGVKLASVPVIREALLGMAEAAVDGLLAGAEPASHGGNGSAPPSSGKPTA